MKVCIVGLGLIGGSIGIDLKKADWVNLRQGVDVNEDHARKAVELGLVDAIETEGGALTQADVIILAIPVNALRALLPQVNRPKLLKQQVSVPPVSTWSDDAF